MHDNTITGLHPANIVDTDELSMYPQDADRVFIAPAHDGYRRVYVLDENGNIVASSERANYRIEGALSGTGDGYDMTVRA